MILLGLNFSQQDTLSQNFTYVNMIHVGQAKSDNMRWDVLPKEYWDRKFKAQSRQKRCKRLDWPDVSRLIEYFRMVYVLKAPAYVSGFFLFGIPANMAATDRIASE